MKAIRIYPVCSAMVIGMLLVAMVGCKKEELEVKDFTENPFDPDYAGPSLFSFDTTFVTVVTFPNGQFFYQVIAFDVDASRFLSDVDYAVLVNDRENGTSIAVGPDPAGSNHFKYFKTNVVQGAPVCLDLHLYNNFNAARSEEICATLQ